MFKSRGPEVFVLYHLGEMARAIVGLSSCILVCATMGQIWLDG